MSQIPVPGLKPASTVAFPCNVNEQGFVPVHPPPAHPAKTESTDGVAVSVKKVSVERVIKQAEVDVLPQDETVTLIWPGPPPGGIVSIVTEPIAEPDMVIFNSICVGVVVPVVGVVVSVVGVVVPVVGVVVPVVGVVVPVVGVVVPVVGVVVPVVGVVVSVVGALPTDVRTIFPNWAVVFATIDTESDWA